MQQEDKTKTVNADNNQQMGFQEPIFVRKKSLLTIGQYAARQGVSAEIVQQCAKLGVVQVRKHRDKTFVVDLPFDIHKTIKQQDTQSTDFEEFDSESCTNKLAELVSRILQPPEKTITEEKPKPASCPSPTETVSVQIQHKEEPNTIDELKLLAEEENKITGHNNRSTFRIPLWRSISDSVRFSLAGKLSFAVMIIAVAVSMVVYFRMASDRKIQQEKLKQAYESINKLTTKYEELQRQARLYELDIMSWRAEAERAKNALKNTELELQNTRRSLYDTQKDIENMRQYNAEALKELTEKLTRIRANISNPSIQTNP